MVFILVALIAYVLTFILTPIVIILAKKFRFVDNPKRDHPAILHTGIIPRAGGVPVYLGILLTVIICWLLSSQSTLFTTSFMLDNRILATLVGGLIAVVVGTIDDKFEISPYLRLLSNVLVALVVVSAGIGITFITNPLGGQLRLDQIVLEFNLFGDPRSIILIADIVAIFWIVWMMNAVNWSSGVDGQLSGIVSVATFILGLVALRYYNNDPSQIAVLILAFATGGAYLGFLPFHFFPQKIMPGYGGSSLAGMLLAVLSILAGGRVATALIILIVPLVDALFTIVRRILSGKSPFYGDRQHFHHKLLDLGFSKSQIAFIYTFATIVFGLFALGLDSKSKLFALVSLSVVTLAVIVSITVSWKKTKS